MDMHKDDHIWKKAFEKADLSNEHWLEPSASVFDNVEAEIYKKKRRNRFIFVFLGIFFLGVSGCLLTYGFKANSSESDPSISKIKMSIEDGSNSDLSAQPSDINDLLPASLKGGESADGVSNLSQHAPESPSNIEFSNPSNKKSLASKVADNSKSSLVDDFYSVASSLQTPQSPIIEKVIDISEARTIASKEKGVSVSRRNELHTLILNSAVEGFRNDRSIPDPWHLLNNTKSHGTNNSLSLGIGYSNWFFNLNENYRTALDPADFRHGYGQGINLNLSYKRSISKRLKVGLDAGFEQVNSTSGHNSSLEYSLEREHGGQVNDIDVQMATPLGFVNSTIVIERQGVINGISENVVVDLHNTHTIQNLTLAPNVNYTVLRKATFDIDMQLAIGVNYLSSVQNSLHFFTLDKEGFSALQGQINEGQTQVNTFTPFTAVGISAKKYLIGGNFIGVDLRANRNLAPIFTQEDFSTSIFRSNINIVYGKRF